MESKRGKISVIMGVYNAEDTITESIESVLNQTYNNLELIMCDDGSNDNTINIINSYVKKDSRIKLLKNKENKGLAYSLNRCIEVSNGEFIARHDADDICMLNRFEKQINYFNKHKNDIVLVGSAVEYFNSEGTWGKHYIKEFPNKLDVFKKSMFSHPTILIRKDVLNEVENYTVSDITYRTEDYDLFAKLYSKGYKGANMQEILFRVRRDKDAYSRRKFKFRIDESICKYRASKMLKIRGIKRYIIVIPIIKGIIPIKIFRIYHKLKFKK
ncbi:glycosyltransferase [Clostridium perfringens]|uniref:glycosyltransferase family 2 protein n=1 Tax=Clostridium perfringens TaxID=1502 RepID=UPI0029075EDE|nr:glycosyltransferase [Clostridium perfringens]MDK0754899.1 glycosyltransferase [Clostridium perfringens]MDK0756651.1 glycosyltransferase [Clostridium perfringens]MDU7107628.1 glycosyltransferase [Clostridium perfringens]MDZ5063716.1 glycosyltransferase [Clostridium perfringens]